MAFHPVTIAAKVLIQGMILEGLSSRGIMASLRGMGHSFRTTNMLSDLRSLRGVFKFQQQIERLAPERLIPRSFVIEEELKRGTNYRFIGEATFRNKLTGEEFSKVVSWYDNDAAIKQELGETFTDDYNTNPYNDELEILFTDVKQVIHDPRMPY